MGPSAGGAVYSPAITDLIIMVEKTSKMFITGPKVIETVTGEQISAEDLGGAQVHNTKSGNAHMSAKTEEEALDMVRTVLSYRSEERRVGKESRLRGVPMPQRKRGQETRRNSREQ